MKLFYAVYAIFYYIYCMVMDHVVGMMLYIRISVEQGMYIDEIDEEFLIAEVERILDDKD